MSYRNYLIAETEASRPTNESEGVLCYSKDTNRVSKWSGTDWVQVGEGIFEVANANIQTHVASAHAPSNAQKNSDITQAEIEAKLTGAISSHSHAGGTYVHPNHSGEVTSTGDGATVIVNDAVTNAKMANMVTKTYKGRTAGTTGDPEDVAVATLKTDLALVKGDVGLGNVDNTTDAGKPVSTAANTVFNAILAIYRTVLTAAGSHIAARVAGTYGFAMGDALAITGVGTLYPLQIIRIDSADYPTVNSLAPKFRIKVTLAVNDAAPTGNFTFGLHPVTRPATSGSAGLNIYTIGTVVTGSTVLISAPAVDTHNTGTSADFALPADGYYVLGVVTSATVATSSHLHMTSKLLVRNA